MALHYNWRNAQRAAVNRAYVTRAIGSPCSAGNFHRVPRRPPTIGEQQVRSMRSRKVTITLAPVSILDKVVMP